MANPSKVYDAEISARIRNKIYVEANTLNVQLSGASVERIQKRFLLWKANADVEGNSAPYNWEKAVREELDWLNSAPNDREISINPGSKYYDLTRGE